MLGQIFGFLLKGPLDRIFDTIDHKIDNETERQKVRGAVIQRYVEVQADIKGAQMSSRVFWYVWAGIAAPLGFWFGAVCLDSVFLFSGNIADLPPSVKPYANQIFASVFGSGAAVGTAQAIGAAIRGRR